MPKSKRDRMRILKNKAWDVFSKWIRNRDRHCVSCGKAVWDSELGEYNIKGLQAGHFHHNVLDFDEININAQCTQCNHFKSGNLANYSIYLLNKHGEKEFMELGLRANKAIKGEKRTEEEYEEIIKKYG